MKKLTMILVLAVGLGSVMTPASGLTKGVEAPVTSEMTAQPDANLMNLIAPQLATVTDGAAQDTIAADSGGQSLGEELEVYLDLVRSGAVARVAEFAERFEKMGLNEACVTALNSEGVISGDVPLAETMCKRREGGGIPNLQPGGGRGPSAGEDPNCKGAGTPPTVASRRGWVMQDNVEKRPDTTDGGPKFGRRCASDGTCTTTTKVDRADGTTVYTTETTRANGEMSSFATETHAAGGGVTRQSTITFRTDGSFNEVETHYNDDGTVSSQTIASGRSDRGGVVVTTYDGNGNIVRSYTIRGAGPRNSSPNARRPVRPNPRGNDTPRAGDEPGIESDELIPDLLMGMLCVERDDKWERFEKSLWEPFGGSPDFEYTEECQSPVEGEAMDNGESARPCLYPTLAPEDPISDDGCTSDTPCINDGNGVGRGRSVQGIYESLAATLGFEFCPPDDPTCNPGG